MIKSVMLVLLTFVSLAVHAETMEWNIDSQYEYKAQISFYSMSRNREWPGGGRSYTLHYWRDYQYLLECTPGEKICYGAWDENNPSAASWGVGLRNTRSCTSCCRTCGDGPVKMILKK